MYDNRVYQALSPSTREVPFAKKRRRAVHSREDVRPAILVFAICRKINADSNEVESDLVNCRGRDRAPCNVLQFQSLEVAQTAHSATRVSKTDSAGCTWFVLPEECSGARRCAFTRWRLQDREACKRNSLRLPT